MEPGAYDEMMKKQNARRKTVVVNFGWSSFRRGCYFVLTIEAALGAIALFVWLFFGGGR